MQTLGVLACGNPQQSGTLRPGDHPNMRPASSAVTEMGGKVAKKLGDGLMALFGYPIAQENDTERAGPCLRERLHPAHSCNGHSGSPDLGPFALAEWICGEVNRLHPT